MQLSRDAERLHRTDANPSRCSASEQGGAQHFASRLIGEREIVRLIAEEVGSGQWRKFTRSR
jgi:hypothetical protein